MPQTKTKTTPKPKLVNLTMRITQQEHDEFKILATKKSRSMTELFREWLEKALKSSK